MGVEAGVETIHVFVGGAAMLDASLETGVVYCDVASISTVVCSVLLELKVSVAAGVTRFSKDTCDDGCRDSPLISVCDTCRFQV